MIHCIDRACRRPLRRPLRGAAAGQAKLLLGAAILLLAISALIFAVQAQPSESKAPTTAPESTLAATDTTGLERRVIAYYFHTNYRCATCRQLEAYSHEAIEAAFPAELESGRLEWRLVNVEEKGNEHFVEDYQLYTKALVIVEETKGKQVRWKNLEKVWELLPRREKFEAYVQDEVRIYLNEVP